MSCLVSNERKQIRRLEYMDPVAPPPSALALQLEAIFVISASPFLPTKLSVPPSLRPSSPASRLLPPSIQSNPIQFSSIFLQILNSSPDPDFFSQFFISIPLQLLKMEVKRRTASTLVSRLSSVSEQIRFESLSELRLMTKNDADSRSLIVEAGATPYLAETLYSSSNVAQEHAAATLLNLSISSREALISTRGLLDAISHALGHHSSSSSAAAVQSCAATLHSLLVVDEYRPIIGSKRDIIYSLVDILKYRKSPQRSIKDALKALFGIALHQSNRSTMVDLGVIPPLFSLVVVGDHPGIVEDASAVVAQVAGCEESELAFRRVSGLGVLVDLLDSGTDSSPRTKENAVSALLNLARWGGERAVEDVKDLGSGILSEIADMAVNGSEKGKTKAVELLKVIANGGIDGNVFKDLHLDSLINPCSE